MNVGSSTWIEKNKELLTHLLLNIFERYILIMPFGNNAVLMRDVFMEGHALKN